MKDSVKLVAQTLDFEHPERAPRQVWDVPWTYDVFPNEIAALKKRFPEDIEWCPQLLLRQPERQGEPTAVGVYVDEWGCRFENRFKGIIGEVKEPLVRSDDWEEFGSVRFPDGLLRPDVDAVNAYCRESDKFVLSCSTVRIFERLQFIAGTEKVLMDLLIRPEGMTKAIGKLHAFFCEELEAWAKTDVDGLFIQDDWGSQRSLIISPALWLELFKPLYRDYAEIAARKGKRVFMHSDGYILDIFPHLIDIGIDAVNSQLFCMGVENLRPFKGKITFWGEIDRQGVLPSGSIEDVASAVRSVKDNLWKDGGCIAQSDFGIGVKPENVFHVFETWEKIV
ncbi:MAG: methyltransferase [Clostridiales Family XIII bacterium]|nr:methyltransferase [Clostridiales Family XIII bacterium]